MSRSRTVPVVLALLAVSTLGVAATSLETTLTTDPGDAIDPSWEHLPIGEDDAATIRDEMDGDADTGETRPTGANEGTDGPEHRPGNDGTGDRTAPADRADKGDGNAPGTLGFGSGGGVGSSATPPLPFLWLSLLVCCVVTATVAYRYRARLRSLFGLAPTPTDAPDPSSEGARPGASPSNVVERAWVTMVTRLNPDRPESTTPAECRALARDRDADAMAVDAIATSFERVRYGGIPVDEEADRARAALERLDRGAK
ncbi:DUF4129 domain-containing protein [Haloplanus sp.]|uniref:DUF4129 domain-containing protein n=1 Tax=Haloplanus sp. TaxID=1961696 RepID=UPI002634D1C5|nr:DUF4129 domain-containing protein [Haloplanus sp.]